MPYIQAEVVPNILDEFVEDPRVRDLIREQSLGLLWDALEVLRGACHALTTSSSPLCATRLPRAGRERAAPGGTPPRRNRSHAGIVSRSAGAGLDILMISLVAAQGLATALSLIGSVLDPIPSLLVAILTFASRCSVRSTSRSPGAPSAAPSVAPSRATRSSASTPRRWGRQALVRSGVSFFVLPIWAVGMIGTAFDPLRRSWVDRVLGSRTPYLVHVERKSRRTRSEWSGWS